MTEDQLADMRKDPFRGRLMVAPSMDYKDLEAFIIDVPPSTPEQRDMGDFWFRQMLFDATTCWRITMPSSEDVKRWYDEIAKYERGTLVLGIVMTYPSGRTMDGGFVMTHWKSADGEWHFNCSINT